MRLWASTLMTTSFSIAQVWWSNNRTAVEGRRYENKDSGLIGCKCVLMYNIVMTREDENVLSLSPLVTCHRANRALHAHSCDEDPGWTFTGERETGLERAVSLTLAEGAAHPLTPYLISIYLSLQRGHHCSSLLLPLSLEPRLSCGCRLSSWLAIHECVKTTSFFSIIEPFFASIYHAYLHPKPFLYTSFFYQFSHHKSWLYAGDASKFFSGILSSLATMIQLEVCIYVIHNHTEFSSHTSPLFHACPCS